MAAAEHGADFPMAKEVRGSMSKEQMHDFAATKEKNKPEHKKEAHHGRHKTSEHAPSGRKPNLRGGK